MGNYGYIPYYGVMQDLYHQPVVGDKLYRNPLSVCLSDPSRGLGSSQMLGEVRLEEAVLSVLGWLCRV